MFRPCSAATRPSSSASISGSTANAAPMSSSPCVPTHSNDMAGAVVDVLLIEQGQRGDTALVVQTEISSAPHLRGQILMMPDPASVPKILEALREHPAV